MNTRVLVYGGLAMLVALSWVIYLPSSQPAKSVALVRATAPVLFASAASLPSPLERPILEAALRDPFASIARPLPIPELPPPKAFHVAEIPPAPAAPPLNLQFAGRMTEPDGKLVVFAALGSETVRLQPGTALANGYVVQQVDEHGVELLYPPLNTTARLELPTLPPFEVR